MSWQNVADVNTDWNKEEKAYILKELSELIHDIDGYSHSLVKIDSTHVSLAYDTDESSIVKIFSVDSDYKLTELSKLIHDTSSNRIDSATMCLADSSHLFLSYYSYEDSKAYVKTFGFDEEYTITELDEVWTGDGRRGHDKVLKIDETHFILSTGYISGTTYYSKLLTFSIDSEYSITLIHELIHDVGGFSSSLTAIDSSHFVLAIEQGPDELGCIKTINIDSEYTISVINTIIHDVETGYNAVTMVDSNHFVLAFLDYTVYKGKLKTFSLDESYSITELKSLVHQIDGGYNNTIVKVDENTVLVEYLTDDSAFTRAFNIDNDYEISIIDTLEVGGDYGSIISLHNDIYALAYVDDIRTKSVVNILRFSTSLNIWNKQTKPTTIWEVQ